MTIALLCPNGHKLFCPEDTAGKRGKCPQCGATFRVPELSSVPPEPENTGLSTVGLAPKPVPVTTGKGGGAAWSQSPTPGTPTAEPPAPVVKEAPAPAEPEEEKAPENPIHAYHDGDKIANDEVLFLCPNGHQLSGPISLAGNAGTCPECNTEFLVPTEEELEEPEMDQLLIGIGAGGDAETVEEEDGTAKDNLGRLFDSLWFYRSQGATLELHLGDGKILVPDGYAPHLSKQGQGVFMRREGNGSFTITAVDWEAIRYVAVRGVRDLPEGVFDQPAG